ncbi:MAG: recombinase family protein [Clostridium sp.]|jgi:site-specific DNA recombinase|nr:recombinase family protein [Clostridium sp.]
MKRVAIYSRKSKFTGKGDSIENQIEICKNYIKTSYDADVEFNIYEDEGYTGSNLFRPQFSKLIKDIKSSKIDILVCYKLDRISRNVSDFSSTLDMLTQYKCSFISVSEQFDTSTPMGRAMIYIASVFAQLERETIAERVKDNMLEMAKNGKWTGGKTPLGFKSEKINYIDENDNKREYTKLIPDKEESKFVEFLYKKYLELGSLHKLEIFTYQNNLKSKNNTLIEKSSLSLILKNPIYVKSTDEVINYLKENNWIVYGDADGVHSLLTYNKTQQIKKNGKTTKIKKPLNERIAAMSSIDGFIDAELWLKVQQQIDENKDKFPRLGKTNNALLTGKLRCGNCGEYMLIQHGKVSKSTGLKLFYYVCSLKRKSKCKLCNNSNANSAQIEESVIFSLKQLATNKKIFIDELKRDFKFSTSNMQNEKLSLEKTIAQKKKQIDNLVNKLSFAEDIDTILMDKIKLLKIDISELEKKVLDLSSKKENKIVNNLNIELIESLLNKCENIEKLTRDEQKELIELLIDTIYWYGPDNDPDSNNKKGSIKIKFSANSESELTETRLQFSSPGMSSI